MRIDVNIAENAQNYQLLNSVVSPRPIAWVTSCNQEGLVNLAPHSWTTVVSVNPPMIGFTSSTEKDTLRNIRATKEFVYNVVTERLSERMNMSAISFPPDISELDELGFAPAPSEHINVPGVAESPLRMECKLVDIHTHGNGPAYFIVGEVLAFHVSDDVMNGKYVDPQLIQAVGRMSGPHYTRTTDTFTMERMDYEQYQNR